MAKCLRSCGKKCSKPGQADDSIQRTLSEQREAADTVRILRTIFGRNEAPSAPGVRQFLRKVRETGMLMDNRSHPRARPLRTAERIAAVAQRLSETWLDDKIDNNQIAIDGYNLIRRDRDGRGGGVAFYIDKSIKFKLINTVHDESLEQIWINVKIEGSQRTSVITDPLFKLVLNGVVLVPTDVCKNLGLYINNDLRCTKHSNPLSPLRDLCGKE
ncbi:hypothetical protein NQ318_013831 [Aromia moschata]|uniref:DUF4817 domain-containing protein n=1 Tax=Aromia moschata TaxID=1265417 RepID=A0AAV8ZAE4_9CUCU|nr:hypothetical protein NQ318_013831 [Aromia moschata]